MNEILQAFDFESLAVRVLIQGEQPWFVAADVCRILGISNNREAVAALEDDEKNTVGITDGNRGNPNHTVISESGLYALIFKSRKPEARRFRKWVTSEVLPAIRRGGNYKTGDVAPARNIAEWLESLGLGVKSGVEVREIMIRRVWQSAALLGWRVNRQTDGWAEFPQPVLDHAMAVFAARDLRPALAAA